MPERQVQVAERRDLLITFFYFVFQLPGLQSAPVRVQLIRRLINRAEIKHSRRPEEPLDWLASVSRRQLGAGQPFTASLMESQFAKCV